MHSMAPYHGFYGRDLEVFDPFSLYFWDPIHHDFPFRGPLMMPPPPPLMPPMERLPTARSKIEYKETPEAHHFKAELPGVRKEDVKVEVEGKMLHISAKKRHEMEEKKDKYHHVERGFGEFVSKFKLPHNSRPEHVRSYMENGVLNVTIPKEKVDKVEQSHCY